MLSDATILEIGAGTGITSIIASKICNKMIATDYSQDIVNLIKVVSLYSNNR